MIYLEIHCKILIKLCVCVCVCVCVKQNSQRKKDLEKSYKEMEDGPEKILKLTALEHAGSKDNMVANLLEKHHSPFIRKKDLEKSYKEMEDGPEKILKLTALEHAGSKDNMVANLLEKHHSPFIFLGLVTNICKGSKCPLCNGEMSPDHYLHCSKASSGRTTRHNSILDALVDFLKGPNTQLLVEVDSNRKSAGTRPDAILFNPTHEGPDRTLIDVVCSDPSRNLNKTKTKSPGKFLSSLENDKFTKYKDRKKVAVTANRSVKVVIGSEITGLKPFAVSTIGSFGRWARSLLNTMRTQETVKDVELRDNYGAVAFNTDRYSHFLARAGRAIGVGLASSYLSYLGFAEKHKVPLGAIW
ncbi:hypothetical protein ADUPG1_012125 [Aduncisulcus paluster]|uniref:Uncharacterized protein n=1 Tax=Aduncisulcus paluster TaxID=2918883 RepID=A0ABQ5JYE9_9EUKA|nr:hypothetical protein ADUPG1_012125 [Aduncisulcus paluster]